jgi:hypothetical protein
MTSVTTFNTFADYYMNVDDGTSSNRAVARFNEAMDTTKTTTSKYVDCWTNPQGVVIVHLEHGGIAVVHGVKSVGGTVIDHGVGASTVALTIPNNNNNC